MTKKTLGLGVLIGVLVFVVAAIFVQADVLGAGSVQGASSGELLQLAPVEASATAFPEGICPGYNIHYTFVLSNTSTTRTFDTLAVTDSIPEGMWFNEAEADHDIGGTIPGTYNYYYDVVTDTEYRWVSWQTSNMGPGQVVECYLMLHTLTSMELGGVVTNTFQYTATEGIQVMEGEVAVGLQVDISYCVATATPTPTNTPTNTPTPTPTNTPTDTPEPTVTYTPEPTDTVPPTPTSTPTPKGLLWFLPLVYKQ